MAVNKKSLLNLEKGKKTQFSAKRQPANPGRKPSALRFIRDEGVSVSDIRRIIGSLIWEYDSEELSALLKTAQIKVTDNDGKEKIITKVIDPVPMGVNLVLNALLDDLNNKTLVNFEKLMDRAHGKPEKTINHEIGVIPPETLALLDSVFTQKESGRKPKKSVRKPGKTEN